jgi:hypothetical protein
MHRIAVAGDGLGDADLLKLGQQGARVGLQAASVVADAGVRQLRFADAKDRRQIAGVFAGVVDFGLLVAFVYGVANAGFSCAVMRTADNRVVRQIVK